MIEVKDLVFTYPGATKPALKGITFEIAQGEVLGFLGPSGAGKSTTQKILIGLLSSYQGTVRVKGKEVNDWGPDYYEHIGVSFEVPNHYLKLTGLENLNYFRSLYSGEVEAPMRLLELVGLADDGDTPVGQYSKGMRVRLTVARSLLHKPELIFLDEPTAGLDPVNARKVMAIVERLQAEGRTIFLTTHNMQVADRLADRVAFIVDGEIPTIDAPRDLKLRHGKRQVQVEFHQNGSLAAQTFPLDGLGENNTFIELIRRENVETIHTQETTLENVFIEVTGRELG
ncbi:MAG: ABC transporter ATP-binding protein [Anaerolineae bacterium]